MQAPPRLPWLLIASLFYGPLAAVALLWLFVRGDELGPLFGRSGLPGLGLGIGVGLLVVGAGRLFSRISASARRLEAAFRFVLSGVRPVEVVGLALSSAVAEELFFRAALLPALGLLGSSLVFGALHSWLPEAPDEEDEAGPRNGRFPPGIVWFLFAVAMGGLLGALLQWTGSLWAPIGVHLTVNLLNLWTLSRDDPAALPPTGAGA